MNSTLRNKNIVNKRGHTSGNFQKYNVPTNKKHEVNCQFGENQPGNNLKNVQQKKCSLCGQFGHVYGECTVDWAVCYICKKSGHTGPGCPEKVAEQKQEGNWCIYCQKNGHIIENCRKVKCRNCGIQGHIDKQCPRKYDMSQSDQMPSEGQTVKNQKATEESQKDQQSGFLYCAFCQDKGDGKHTYKDCTNPQVQCRNCGEFAHNYGICPNEKKSKEYKYRALVAQRERCFLCDEYGHKLQDCPWKEKIREMKRLEKQKKMEEEKEIKIENSFDALDEMEKKQQEKRERIEKEKREEKERKQQELERQEREFPSLSPKIAAARVAKVSDSKINYLAAVKNTQDRPLPTVSKVQKIESTCEAKKKSGPKHRVSWADMMEKEIIEDDEDGDNLKQELGDPWDE